MRSDIASRGMAIIDSIAEERRVDAIRQDFVANVSHELKTPVGAMSLLADALDSASSDEDRTRLVRHAPEGGEAGRGHHRRPARARPPR